MNTNVATENIDTSDSVSGDQHSSTVKAFIELSKPRISVMVLMTVLVAGMISLPVAQPQSGWLLMHAMIGLMFVSASGCAMNQYLERYVDWLMPRTAKRPLPAQRLSARQVSVFGATTFGIGVAWLFALTNWQTALVAITNWVFYVWLYTPLKLRTWLNTYVGAIAGALPILIGSTAVCQGQITTQAWSFFAVLVLWQFPHFMAIAWLYRNDYKAASIKMATTVDDTGRLAGWHAIAFSVALIPVTLISIWLVGDQHLSLATGVLLIATMLLGSWYVKRSVIFAQSIGETTSRRLFRTSLVHLSVWLVLLSITALK